jgi:hypothetical protein
MHAPEGVLRAGQGDHLLRLASEIVPLDRDAEAGIGLAKMKPAPVTSTSV